MAALKSCANKSAINRLHSCSVAQPHTSASLHGDASHHSAMLRIAHCIVVRCEHCGAMQASLRSAPSFECFALSISGYCVVLVGASHLLASSFHSSAAQCKHCAWGCLVVRWFASLTASLTTFGRPIYCSCSSLVRFAHSLLPSLVPSLRSVSRSFSRPISLSSCRCSVASQHRCSISVRNVPFRTEMPCVKKAQSGALSGCSSDFRKQLSKLS